MSEMSTNTASEPQLRLDPKTKILQVGLGRPVPLTGKEWEAANYIADRGEQGFNVMELARHLWPNSAQTEKMLRQYALNRLTSFRQALEMSEPGAKRHLQYIRGKGYRFSLPTEAAGSPPASNAPTSEPPRASSREAGKSREDSEKPAAERNAAAARSAPANGGIVLPRSKKAQRRLRHKLRLEAKGQISPHDLAALDARRREGAGGSNFFGSEEAQMQACPAAPQPKEEANAAPKPKPRRPVPFTKHTR